MFLRQRIVQVALNALGWHPGYARAAFDKAENSSATLDSWPGFDLHVTVSTTTGRSGENYEAWVLRSASVLRPTSAAKAGMKIVCSRSGPVDTIPIFVSLSEAMKFKYARAADG